jgi:hypothetical protein
MAIPAAPYLIAIIPVLTISPGSMAPDSEAFFRLVSWESRLFLCGESFCVQLDQSCEDVLVARIFRPPIGREHCLVQHSVSILQPGGVLIVQVCQMFILLSQKNPNVSRLLYARLGLLFVDSVRITEGSSGELHIRRALCNPHSCEGPPLHAAVYFRSHARH